MLKNKIIELFDTNTKQILYTSLEQNNNIMYTRNARSTPIRTEQGIENVYMIESNNKTYTIVINPDKQQLEYFDYKILNIKEAIENDMETIELVNFLKENDKEMFIQAIESSNFTFSSQYDNQIVYEYIMEVL